MINGNYTFHLPGSKVIGHYVILFHRMVRTIKQQLLTVRPGLLVYYDQGIGEGPAQGHQAVQSGCRPG